MMDEVITITPIGVVDSPVKEGVDERWGEVIRCHQRRWEAMGGDEVMRGDRR